MAKKILCAVDGSEHGLIAVRSAADLAKQAGGELTLIAINVALGGPKGPIGYQWETAEGERLLRDAAAAAKASGLASVHTVLAKGRDPAGSIVHYAHEQGFDHIVTGTGDKGLMRKLVLGSVSRDIAEKAHCTVTIAR